MTSILMYLYPRSGSFKDKDVLYVVWVRTVVVSKCWIVEVHHCTGRTICSLCQIGGGIVQLVEGSRGILQGGLCAVTECMR